MAAHNRLPRDGNGVSVKVVILAGGRGTRLAEETEAKPKPMVEIGGRPILWHIMKIYAAQGYRDFVIALGYKGELIKHYFLDYAQVTSDFMLNTKSGKVDRLGLSGDDWNIHFVDTGLETQTGGRVGRLSRETAGRVATARGVAFNPAERAETNTLAEALNPGSYPPPRVKRSIGFQNLSK